MYEHKDDIPQIRWLPIYNGAGSEAPPFALLRVVSVDNDTGIITVGQPNADGQNCLVNGPHPVASGAYGAATEDSPVFIYYDTADGTPANGETWGAENASWKANKNKSGFIIRGGVDATLAIVEASRVSASSSGGDTTYASGADVVFQSGSTATYQAGSSLIIDAGTIVTGFDKICQGRLTLTTGVPVTSSDVTGGTSVYFAPYAGNGIDIYDGTNWKRYTFTEKNVAVPSTTVTPFDVFIYDNSGTLTLETVNWTNDTTRATALTVQDGVLCKSGALTRRYLGTGRTTGSSGQTEDSLTKRFVWNYYNRIQRKLKKTDSTDTWDYTSLTYRAANGDSANMVEVVIGWDESIVEVTVGVMARNTNANVSICPGIGIDSSSTQGADLILANNTPTISTRCHAMALLRHIPAVGYHYYQWLEASSATGTTTWYGDGGAPTFSQAGILGSLWG